MNETVIIIIALALLGGFIGFLLLRRRKKRKDDEWKARPFDRAMKIIAESAPTATHSGIKVYFERGTNPATFSLPSVDVGIDKAFEKIGCAPFTNGPIDRSQHRIAVVSFQSIIAPESGIPAYKIYINHMSQYYQSQWDMERGKGLEVDHYILAAAQLIAIGEPYGDVIVVPHHDGREMELARVVEYEGEHLTLAWYWPAKFEETKYHADGTGHPILPDCGSASLYADHRWKVDGGGLETCSLLVR